MRRKMICIKNFIKLNIMSLLYAIMLVIELQLLVNVYRFSRITGWEVSTVSNLVLILMSIVSILFIVLLVILNRKYFVVCLKIKLITVVLWIPYLILVNFVFNNFFPMTNRGDLPTPILGLISMVLTIAHLFLIFLLSVLTVNKNK